MGILIADERAKRRREIKLQIARRALLEKRADELDADAAALDAEAERAAERHRRVCEPAQAKLRTVEAELAEAIVNRRPIGESLEKKRRELIARIEDENRKLAAAAEEIRQRTRAPREEAENLRMQAAGLAGLESDLMRPGLVDPTLHARRFVAQHALHWATVRRDRASKVVEDAAVGIRDAERRGDKAAAAEIRNRAEPWHAELAAAREVVTAAEVEFHTVSRLMLDE